VRVGYEFMQQALTDGAEFLHGSTSADKVIVK
jgi:hypothetical protein